MVSTVKVTGIIGAGRGTGVTHFSIRAANYFCSWKQRKTAVIQWNSHKDTERMRNFLEASGKEGGRFKKEPFRVLEVDFYCQGGPEVLAAWLRCSEKILIADLSEWKLESFLGLFTEKEKTGKDWICLTAFGSEIVRKEIERQFRLSVKRIPLSVDAFSVDIQTMEWFADILV